jgi:cytochrome c6
MKYILIALLWSISAIAQLKTGKVVFEAKCVRCHGQNGTKGRFGAANLQASRMQDAKIVQIISAGKNWMPAWEKKLQPAEISAVADYVKTLRKS